MGDPTNLYIIGGVLIALSVLCLGILGWSWWRGDDSERLPLEEVAEPAWVDTIAAHGVWQESGYPPPPVIVPVPEPDETAGLKYEGTIYRSRSRT